MSIDQVHKKSGPRWRARITLKSGKRVSRCFRRKVDAVEWEARLTLDGDESIELKRRKTHFSDLAQIFLDQIRGESAVATYQKYDAALRLYLLPKFGSYWVEDIQKLHVSEFKNEVLALSCSPSIKNFVFSALKTIMKRALEWDLLKTNPSVSIKPPRRGSARTEYWTEDEVRGFLTAISNHSRFGLYMIALNTGMRSGEILGLKWDCVDLSSGLIEVRRSLDQKTGLVKETTKTHSTRRIGINEELMPILRRLKANATSEFVFGLEAAGSKRATHMARIFAADCRKAGVRPIRFHDLRHTFATQFVRNDGSIYALASILGHKTTTMTARYAHFGPEHAKRASQVVSFGLPKLSPVIPLRLSAGS